MKKTTKKNSYPFKKKIKLFLIFISVTAVTYGLISPNPISLGVLKIILFAMVTGLSLAFFLSMVISRDKHYIDTIQEKNKRILNQPLKKVDDTLAKLKESLDTTTKLISSQTETKKDMLAGSLPVNFSIVPSSYTDDAYILDKDLKMPFNTPQEKLVYKKIVSILKRNGHHIRVLKPFNPAYSFDQSLDNDTNDVSISLNSINADFPHNLINFN